MNAKEKKVEATSVAKQPLKKAVVEGGEAIEKVAVDAKNQALDVIEHTQLAAGVETQQLSDQVKNQITSLKEELLGKVDQLKQQVNFSQADLTELKDFVRSELSIIVQEFAALGKEFKADVSQISLKHKAHIADTLKRSKAHTVDAWHKVSTKQ